MAKKLVKINTCEFEEVAKLAEGAGLTLSMWAGKIITLMIHYGPRKPNYRLQQLSANTSAYHCTKETMGEALYRLKREFTGRPITAYGVDDFDLVEVETDE